VGPGDRGATVRTPFAVTPHTDCDAGLDDLRRRKVIYPEAAVSCGPLNPLDTYTITMNTDRVPAVSIILDKPAPRSEAVVHSAPDVPLWKKQKYFIPLFVYMHVAQNGNLCRVTNVLQSEVKDPTLLDKAGEDNAYCGKARTSIDYSGFAGEPGWQIQEFSIDFDKNAAKALGISFIPLNGLSLEYKCSYGNGGGNYTTTWAKAGQICGNEAGEPTLNWFSMRLTGPLASDFHLEYSCSGTEATIGPLDQEKPCYLPDVSLGPLGRLAQPMISRLKIRLYSVVPD
jgi:hypothetical protein